jgi:hypothetical protein
MQVCFSDGVWTAPNDVSVLRKKLDEKGGVVRFGMRRDEPDEVSGEPIERRLPEGIWPLGHAAASFRIA